MPNAVFFVVYCFCSGCSHILQHRFMATINSTSLNSSECPFAHLKEGLKNQDRRTIETLYDMYAGTVYNIALRIVKSNDLAANVLQDTFVKIWKNGAKYDAGKGGLFTWIVNIARNTAIDATRSKHFKSLSDFTDLEKVSDYPSSDKTDDETIGVPELLQKMSKKHIILLEKYYIEGYTHAEIVAELGIPLGTIKTRLRNAVTELRVLLCHDVRVFHNR